MVSLNDERPNTEPRTKKEKQITMATPKTTTIKPHKVGDEVFVLHHVPGSPYGVGEKVSIFSVSNQGTKSRPNYRYYVRGAWYDHEALGTSNLL